MMRLLETPSPGNATNHANYRGYIFINHASPLWRDSNAIGCGLIFHAGAAALRMHDRKRPPGLSLPWQPHQKQRQESRRGLLPVKLMSRALYYLGYNARALRRASVDKSKPHLTIPAERIKMDPLSAAASIGGLIGLAGQCISCEHSSS